MIRRLVAADRLEATVSFYEGLLDQPCELRFSYPEVGLTLASVGDVLIIAGDGSALAPFRRTSYTILVSDLDTYAERLSALGAVVIEEPKTVPTGRNMLVQHPDGSVVEYVEHRPRPGELRDHG